MKRRSRRRRWPTALVGDAVIGPCSGDGSEAPAENPVVSPVHALGLRPDDEVLYTATHYGVFTMPPDGTATMIADGYQDTVAFTADGSEPVPPSGHPGSKDEAR